MSTNIISLQNLKSQYNYIVTININRSKMSFEAKASASKNKISILNKLYNEDELILIKVKNFTGFVRIDDIAKCSNILEVCKLLRNMGYELDTYSKL